MRKIILMALLLVLPSVAQNDELETYTSWDGVLQVSLIEGWRVGGIEPDLGVFTREARRRQAPEAYRANLLGSSPDAEIQFYVIDMDRFLDDNEALLLHFQSAMEAHFSDRFRSFMLGETEALELTISNLDTLNLEIGGVNIDLSEARRMIFMEGRNNWLVVALLIDESETVDEDFLTIAESFRFYGSSRNILSLSGTISIDVPEGWFRYQNRLNIERKWESILVHGRVMEEYCLSDILIINLDSPEFEFPEEGSPDEYLEAFLNGRENNYETQDVYAEHLAEGVYLYMMETEDDYEYLSLQVFEKHLIISTIYLGEGYCIDDYFSMINSITEE